MLREEGRRHKDLLGAVPTLRRDLLRRTLVRHHGRDLRYAGHPATGTGSGRAPLLATTDACNVAVALFQGLSGYRISQQRVELY